MSCLQFLVSILNRCFWCKHGTVGYSTASVLGIFELFYIKLDFLPFSTKNMFFILQETD